ncbi:gelsolin-like protein 1 [Actinia tenebrosa]|uniref:Gelsolin-like protein 1 n=1 Tax=Actinia tenebrosa TaxID=6105 RepID=A0A6P8I8X3_ACTTE|nr:gelsolin-like protein 1 [Actinia tenebrosa]
MSGLVKAKEHDVEDSNVENIGSDVDRNLKKKAAETEEAWKKAGEKPGLQIWRIEDFKVVPWPRAKYGEFHRGDSYIVLRTYKEPGSEELEHDLHFWLGKESTQDEMGTAAYKTVELDTLLDDKPVQYREVEGFESKLFKKCFGRITYLEGGVKSGFNHVETNKDDRPPTMFELCGETEKDVSNDQVAKPSWDSLHSYSAFIIFIGRTIIRFYGSKCNKFEKWCASIYVGKHKSSNPRMMEADILIDGDDDLSRRVAQYQKQKKKDDEDGEYSEDEEDESREDEAPELMEKLVSLLGEPPENFDVKKNKEEEDVNKKKEVPCEEGFVKKLVCVERNKRTAKLEIDVVASGEDISKYTIDERFSYILDKGKELFGYTGKKVDKKDKNNQMVYCNKYLCDKVNKHAPISTVKSLRKFEEKMRD